MYILNFFLVSGEKPSLCFIMFFILILFQWFDLKCFLRAFLHHVMVVVWDWLSCCDLSREFLVGSWSNNCYHSNVGSSPCSAPLWGQESNVLIMRLNSCNFFCYAFIFLQPSIEDRILEFTTLGITYIPCQLSFWDILLVYIFWLSLFSNEVYMLNLCVFIFYLFFLYLCASKYRREKNLTLLF